MKKSELYLLFITLFVGLSTLLLVLYKYIKPSTIPLKMEETQENVDENQNIDNGWIERISKNNQKFSYPVTIYKLDF
jgi:hypothetical protein